KRRHGFALAAPKFTKSEPAGAQPKLVEDRKTLFAVPSDALAFVRRRPAHDEQAVPEVAIGPGELYRELFHIVDVPITEAMRKMVRRTRTDDVEVVHAKGVSDRTIGAKLVEHGDVALFQIVDPGVADFASPHSVDV